MEISRRQVVFLLLAVIAAIGVLVAADQFIERISPWDYDDLERWIDDLGAWGPIIYMLFSAASMVFAPLPTTPLPIAAAAVFGAIPAFFYTLLAGAVGASLCFVIARRWGRPALQRFLPDKLVAEIDRVAGQLGARVLFLLRLFPIFGTDVVSYGAGLTPIRYWTYLAITIVGSTPALVLAVLAGEGIRDNRAVAIIAIAALAALLLLPILYLTLRKRRAGPSPLSLPSVDSERPVPPSLDGGR